MKRLLVLSFLLISTISLVGQTLDVERLPDLNIPRAGHNVFYANGELTVVGGHTSGFVMTPTAEYFSNGAWHLISTVYNHDDGMAVVMSDGRRVLLAGGHDKNLGIGQSFEAEMYNSATHTFEGFGSLQRSRALAQGVELADGQVLIAGNHKDNDCFEIFDGKKSFSFVKDVTIWRSAPYLLPISDNDVMAFGSVWRGRFEPCDTVDRLNGEPFTVPLLNDWMPFLYDQNNHANESFIGDAAAGDYSYLIAAYNNGGEVAFIHIKDTVFSLLQTTIPVPAISEYGRIKYNRPAIADRRAKRAYLVGNDSTNRVYVVAVEYAKQPAPITLYNIGQLEDFGDATPILTPDGDLIVAGGIIDDNFAPLASVWLLHTGTEKALVTAETSRYPAWLWVLGGLLLVLAIVAAIRYDRKHRSKPESDAAADELTARIVQLMETQRLYLNPELKVNDVAKVLGVHRNTVSACVNAHKGCSFNQFINDYRVEYAKKLLRETNEIKISHICHEAGFATESTFFRAFKASTGMTPKEWAEKN
ncbi:MAG: helix-turn-helix transcriptional regulator [Bacteroidales bacterium]|nr:helix-turn-helix transcriptional regulator [Bacteroidales bacterium]